RLRCPDRGRERCRCSGQCGVVGRRRYPMSRRDTYIVTVVAVLGVLGAFWFLALSPKREKLSAVDKDVAEAQQTLDQAKQDKVKFARDQIAFPQLYASLGRLGMAV